MVKQGQCFFVSLILTVLAFWAVLSALERLSGANSRQISLASADTPSSWNSSKNLACRVTGGGVHGNTKKRCLESFSSVPFVKETFVFIAVILWGYNIMRPRHCTPTWDSSHHIPTPPLSTLPDNTKYRLSGVSLRTHVLVSLEMVVTTPGYKKGKHGNYILAQVILERLTTEQFHESSWS